MWLHHGRRDTSSHAVAIGVDRDPDEKPVLAEELGPFSIDQIAVRLQRPAHLLTIAALLAMRGHVAVKAISAAHVAGARRRFDQEADMLRAHGTRPLRTGSPSLRRPDTTTLPEGAASGPHNRRRRLSRGPGALSARRGPHAPPGRAAAGRSYAAPPHRPCRQGC